MRVCHVSWEYPPVVYGGLGRHVHALAQAQAALGHDVTVITDHAADRTAVETINGVHIMRAAPAPPDLPFDTDHLLAWVMELNHRLARTGITSWKHLHPDVLHAHDWLVAHATVDLAAVAGTPIVATMHATEAGRHQGWLPTALSRSIHGIESWLVDSAQEVITCSEHMRSEVSRLFHRSSQEITVIPNGIDTGDWPATQRRSLTPTIAYCGRLEWEKGVHTLIDAVARLRVRIPDLRLVIAGDGSQREALVEQARLRRMATRVRFTGWLSEKRLHRVMTQAHAVVVPSIYEPFGLVALEAAALHTPLVLARTGGLAEFAASDSTAVTFSPGDVDDLTRAIEQVLGDARAAQGRSERAQKRLRDHHAWPTLAAATTEVYQRARDRQPAVRHLQPLPPVNEHDLTGNLLAQPPG